MSSKPKSLASEDVTEHEWLLYLNPLSVSEAATSSVAKLASVTGGLANAPKTGLSESTESTKFIDLGSQDQWTLDNHGDLDWRYSQACVERWSGQELLLYLFKHAFTIPMLAYPSTRLLHVRLLQSDGLEEGEVVKLPHPYRLPLMFIGKYIWEAILSALSQASTASTSSAPTEYPPFSYDSTQILHLTRLTQYLLIRAKLKERKSGMERGWRCVAFDRLVTRFYRQWVLNDPKALEDFVKTYGSQEYDRDTFKHDWRRWCSKGLYTFKQITLGDGDIVNGLTFNQYRSPLRFNPKSGEWILQDQFITSKVSTLLSGDKSKPAQQVTVKHQEEENNEVLKDAFDAAEWSSISELTDSDDDNVGTPLTKVTKSHTIQISPASGTTSMKIKLTPAKRRHETMTPHPASAVISNVEHSTPGRSSKRIRVKDEAKADPPLSDIPSSGPTIGPTPPPLSSGVTSNAKGHRDSAMQIFSSLSSTTPVSVTEHSPKVPVKPRPKPRPKAKISTSATTMSQTLNAVSKTPLCVPTTPNADKSATQALSSPNPEPSLAASATKTANLTTKVRGKSGRWAAAAPSKEDSRVQRISRSPSLAEEDIVFRFGSPVVPSSSLASVGTIQIPTIPPVPQSPIPDLAAAVQAMTALVKPFQEVGPTSVSTLTQALSAVSAIKLPSSLANAPSTGPSSLFTTPSTSLLDKEARLPAATDAVIRPSHLTMNLSEASSPTIAPLRPMPFPLDITPISRLFEAKESVIVLDDDATLKAKAPSTSDTSEATLPALSTTASSSNQTTTPTPANRRGRARLINPTIPIISTTELEARRQREKGLNPIPSQAAQTTVQKTPSHPWASRSSNVSVVIQRKGSISTKAATSKASTTVPPLLPGEKEKQAKAVVVEKDGTKVLEGDQMEEKEGSGEEDRGVGEVLPKPFPEGKRKESESTAQNTPNPTRNADIPGLEGVEDQNPSVKPKESAKAKGKRPARSRSSSVEIIGMSIGSTFTPSTSVSKRSRPPATSSSTLASGNAGGKPDGEGSAKDDDDDDDEIEELIERPARKKRKLGPSLETLKKDEQAAITQRALELLVQLVDKQEVLPVGPANSAVEEGAVERSSGWQFSNPDATSRSRALIEPLERDVGSVTRELKELGKRVEDVEKGLVRDLSVKLPETMDVVTNDSSSSPIPDEDNPKGVTLPKEDGKSPTPHFSLDLDNPEMRASLAIVVDNLVSTKLLALNQTVRLLKPSHSGSESPTRLGSPSTSLGPSASVASVSNDTLVGSSVDSVTVTNLMDEIKALREESIAKEQRDKEELHSMRQLHSAEVDALRRRLAYLESQAQPPFDIYDRTRHYPPPLPYDGYGPVSAPTRGEKQHYYDRHSEHYHESSYRHRERHHPELERSSASASRPFSPPPGRERNKRGEVLQEEAPLPIKSQRKQHIMNIPRSPAT